MQILRFSHTRRADFKLPEETYRYPVLLAAEEGAFSFQIGDEEENEAAFGDLVLCPPGSALRRRVAKPPLLFHFFEWDGEPLTAYGKITVRNAARLEGTFRELRRLAGNASDATRTWRAHLLRDLLFLAWQAAEEPPRAPDPLMDEAAQAFTTRAGQQDLSISGVAESLGLSGAQFTRRFQKAYGKTPQTFLTDRRLEIARAYLTTTDATLERIAAACGYRDGFYLCRVFTRRMRIAPSAYRRQNRV